MVPNAEKTITGSTGFAVLSPKFAIYREFNDLGLTSESNPNRLTTVASGAAYSAVNLEVVTAQTTASSIDLIERHRAKSPTSATGAYPCS